MHPESPAAASPGTSPRPLTARAAACLQARDGPRSPIPTATGRTTRNDHPTPSPPLEDIHLTAARKVLAELPAADDTDTPWYWIGRLRVALQSLADVAAPGGMDTGQREVLAQALADAIAYRTPEALLRPTARPGPRACATSTPPTWT